MYIVIAILLFGILIAIHEFGHFIAAKSLGVKVNEFSIGMGPALLKKQGKETLYALRLLPIGGYCAMEGEDEETDDPRCFTKQAGWKKLIILAAGSFMNLLLGFVLLLIVFAPAEGFRTAELTGFMDGCPYESEDAFQTGDTIWSIDGHRIYFSDNVSTYLNRGGDTHDIVIKRNGEKLRFEDMTLTRVEYEGYDSPMYGFYFSGTETHGLQFVKYAWYQCVDFVRQTWLALSDLVRGAFGIKDLSGVVGIVDMINDVGKETQETSGFGAAMTNIVYLCAFIAVNLAVMNMLPIPALDGGRIFFLLINGVCYLVAKKTIPPKYEGYVHTAGMVLLLILMAVVMFNDIKRIIM